MVNIFEPVLLSSFISETGFSCRRAEATGSAGSVAVVSLIL